MSTTDDDDLLTLLTKPLSESELKHYQDLIEGEQFQQMVRAYHTQATLDALRQVVRRCLEEKRFSFESTFVAVTSFWLKRLSQMNPQFDEAAMLLWMKTPALLSQMLLQFALDSMQERADEMSQSYPVELEEMYASWKAFLPSKVNPEAPVTQKMLRETEKVLKVFESIYEQLESDPNLRVEAIDHVEIWTQLLLQLYLFGVLDEPKLYYMLFNNWKLFSRELPILLSMLQLLRGYEELLMPHNRDKFNGLMQDPQVQQALLQRLQSLAPAQQDP